MRDLLKNRDGLMLGICNGFQALIKLGLVPYGDIVPMTAECPTLTFNTIGRHQSRLVRTRVASNCPRGWRSRGRRRAHHRHLPRRRPFRGSDDVLTQLKANGQIATQYVDEAGVPGMDLTVNPNGSLLAIEGITSPDGRVFGKMGHSERLRQRHVRERARREGSAAVRSRRGVLHRLIARGRLEDGSI